MSGQAFPTWAQKTQAIRDAVAWAAGGICGEWKFKRGAFSLPDDNDAWFDLRMGRMLELGTDETRYEDNVDPATGAPDIESPRKDVACGVRQFLVELRFYNRDQEHDAVAWLVAERARTRLRMPYVRERWLNPAGVALVELLQVIPMPSPEQAVGMRWQSEAVLEADFSTVFIETDGAAIGTWIERVEGTGKFNCAIDPGPFPFAVDADRYVQSNGVIVTIDGVPVTTDPKPPTPASST